MFDARTQIFLFDTILLVFIVFIVLFILFRSKSYKLLIGSNGILCLLTLFCICFIGIREWWKEEFFVDSIRYGMSYLDLLKWDSDLEDAKDVGFNAFSLFCASIGCSVDVYFVLCACLYVIPLALVSFRLSKNNCVLFFLFIITSMSFYNYGVNGIRNGIATSLLLYAIICYKHRIRFIFFAILAVLFHKSVLLPFAAFLIVCSFPRVKFYSKVWLFSIPLRFLLFQMVSDIIFCISFITDRAENYFSGEANADVFSRVGFRYDFLLYSAVPIVIGFYFFFRKNFKDVLYERLFCSYLLCNAFWVLINQVPFSNRFAYLSWFMMPILVLYPFIFCSQVRYRYSKIAIMLLGYYCFTLVV